MMTTLDDSDKDTTDVEIAAFSALVRSSSGGYNDNDNDNDNSSLVSLDDERLGLLLHGEEENNIRVIDIGDNAHGKEVHVGSADIVLAEDKGRSGDDDDDDDTLFDSPNCRGYFRFLLGRIKSNPTISIATMFMGILTTYLWTNEGYQNFGIRHNNNNANNKNSLGGEKNKGRKKSKSSRPISFPAFPAKPLLGISIRKKQHFIIESESPMDIEPPYSPDDFIYETKSRKTRTLTYWEEIVEAIELSSSYNEGGGSSSNDNTTIAALWENISNWGPCFPRPLQENHEPRLLRSSMAKSSIPLNWTDIVQANSHQILNEESIVYPTFKKSHHVQPMEESLGGLCRPGFIIIGQGKCGTSSLYHYLTGHPRILPAKEKQIHYFRYHKSKPLAWYYSHFPTIETFLGNGALMSGEASPGYMPYPNVVESLTKVLSPNWRPSSDSGDDNNDNGHGVKVWKEKIRSLPKIIAIVRDPINRAQSSYKYNYIEPALKKLKNGRGLTASGQRIPGGKTERYYRQHYLFSFEELVYAELAMLRECLEYGGRGEQWTTKRFGRKSDMFFYEPIQRRKYNNNTMLALDAPPLIHLDEACYIETESKSVPRAQWVELAKEHPNKTLALPNLHLIQSIVGRGIYSYPLEWWYLVFGEDSIHVVCTEDMANTPNSVMDNVTSFLGLPDYDYTNVTSIGRYNVGGHRGYDTITKKLQDDDGDDDDDSLATSVEEKEEELPLPHVDDGDLLAISNALRNELLHFYQLYNERLFHLIDKRCPWE